MTENVNRFNLTLSEYSALKTEYQQKGYTKIEQRSVLPIGQALGNLKLFDGQPKFNFMSRTGKTQAGDEFKIIIGTVKVKATSLGKNYGNVTASFDDNLELMLSNPQNWTKQLTLETVTIPRNEREINVTTITSID